MKYTMKYNKKNCHLHLRHLEKLTMSIPMRFFMSNHMLLTIFTMNLSITSILSQLITNNIISQSITNKMSIFIMLIFSLLYTQSISTMSHRTTTMIPITSHMLMYTILILLNPNIHTMLTLMLHMMLASMKNHTSSMTIRSSMSIKSSTSSMRRWRLLTEHCIESILRVNIHASQATIATDLCSSLNRTKQMISITLTW